MPHFTPEKQASSERQYKFQSACGIPGEDPPCGVLFFSSIWNKHLKWDPKSHAWRPIRKRGCKQQSCLLLPAFFQRSSPGGCWFVTIAKGRDKGPPMLNKGMHAWLAVRVCPSSPHHLLTLNTVVCMEFSPKAAQCRTANPSLSLQVCDQLMWLPLGSKETREAFLKCY